MNVHDHHCLMEGDLLEIDQDSLGAVERVKGFLLDDFLVIAMFVSNKYVKHPLPASVYLYSDRNIH